MHEDLMNQPPASPARRFGCLHVLLFVFIAVVLTAAGSFYVYKVILFPSAFTPVVLNAREEQELQDKLERLAFTAPSPAPPAKKARPPLEPEVYSEKGAERTIRFTEKELNAILAKNTDLADKVAIDLSQDLVSAKVLIPLEEDFPFLGGKTLRVKTGVTFSYADGQPVVMLRGVSVMGLPLPNAWLGGLKNIDVVKASGGRPGFWKSFSEGVKDLRVQEGSMTIVLKE